MNDFRFRVPYGTAVAALTARLGKAYLSAHGWRPWGICGKAGGLHEINRIKIKNPGAPAAKREAEEDWGRWSSGKATIRPEG
jgi:hypothetical protein